MILFCSCFVLVYGLILFIFCSCCLFSVLTCSLLFFFLFFVSFFFFVLTLTYRFFFQVPVDHAVVLRERGVEVRMEFGGTEIAVSCYKQHDGDKLLDAKVSCLRHAVRRCAVRGNRCALCCVLCTACGGVLCANRCVVCCVR